MARRNLEGTWSGGSPQGPDDVNDADGDSDEGTSDNRLIRTLALQHTCPMSPLELPTAQADLPRYNVSVNYGKREQVKT